FFSSRRRHTRWPRDWSSDVCSSDLGSIKFFMKGRKLKGEFALVKMKSAENNAWLLIKHNDDFAVHEPFDSEKLTPASSPINRSRSEEHTSELQSRGHLVCRLLLEKK